MNIKEVYYQFVNFIQTMPFLYYITIVLFCLAGALVCIAQMWKKYDSEKKVFKKPSYIVMALLFFAILVYLVVIRK